MVRSVEEAADRPYAYIVCAVKCLLDIKPTSAILEPLLKQLPSHPTTAIVLLQNGVGIEEDLMKTLANFGANNPVLSGCAWVDTTAVDAGRRIVQHGNERLVMGYHRPDTVTGEAFEKQAQQALDTFCDLLISAGATAERAPDVELARWRKVLWYISPIGYLHSKLTCILRNASFSTLCTLTRANVGDVLSLPESRDTLEKIMLEVLMVARKTISADAAAALPDSITKTIIQNENPKSTFKPSMLVDLEAGRPMEIEAIVGGVVRKARDYELNVPRLEMVYAGLKVVQKVLLAGR